MLALTKTACPRCLRCHRPLKDQHSIDIGYGPNCRMAQKRDGLKGRTRDLFGDSNYYHHIEDGTLIIIDLGGDGRSVTDDIENIISHLKESIDQLEQKAIIYLDQHKIYDGVRLKPDRNVEGFYELNTTSKTKAIKKAKAKVKKWNK